MYSCSSHMQSLYEWAAWDQLGLIKKHFWALDFMRGSFCLSLRIFSNIVVVVLDSAPFSQSAF